MSKQPKPPLKIAFVDQTGAVVEEITTAELIERARQEKARREAECGKDKSCHCHRPDYRDPQCKQMYPLSCPWEDFAALKDVSDQGKPVSS